MSCIQAVLLVSDSEGDTQRYRCQHKREQLALHGVDSLSVDVAEPELLGDVAAFDAIVLHRVPYGDVVDELIRRAHLLGRTVLFDTDDLVFDPDVIPWVRALDNLPREEVKLYVEGVHRYRATLEHCDAVLVSTDYLRRRVEQIGRRALVVRNSLSRDLIRLSERARRQRKPSADRVVLGYFSGTNTHDRDFQEATEALLRILADVPSVELMLVGQIRVDPRFDAFGDRVRRVPRVRWQHLPGLIARADVNLAPLEVGNPFCESKSELKYMEAGIVGVPTVASPTESFRLAIKHGENGFLADGDGEWEECLRSLVADPEMRARVGEAARSHVAAHYSPETRSRELMESLESAQIWQRESASADRPGPRLSIAWALQEPIKGSGGYNSILQMARQLSRFGHDVSVHLRPSDQLRGAGPAEAAAFISRHFFDVEAAVHVGYDFGDADVVVATHWTTACVVNDDVSSRYQKAYFVQDFEPWFYPAGADFVAAERTYSFPMLCLTLGPWLARFLRERYGARAQHFDFAFDDAVYVPGERPPSPRRRVAFYARPSTPRRAFALGAAALQRLHEADPEVEIVLFGDRDLRRHRVGFPFLEMGILSPEQLADLYRSTTVGLSLSCSNPSFVPFEMLSCGCPVVELRSERLEGLLTHGETAYLAEATPGDVADAMLTLLYDDQLRQTIAANGREMVKNWSWESSARQIEQALVAEVERGASERRQSISLPSGSPARPLRRHDDAAQPHGTAFVGEIYGKRVIGQSFVCSEDGLYRVDVKVGTYAGKAHGRIVFRLKTGPDATDSLAVAHAEAGEVLDNTWLAFRFPPIPDSGLRAFYFTLDVPDGMAGLAPTVYYSDEPFPDGRRYEGNVPTSGSLAFRTFVMPPRNRPAGGDDARDRALALAEARLALSQMESEILLSRQAIEPEPADEKAANGNEYVRGRNVSLAGKAWYIVTHRGVLGLARETRDYVRWWLIRRS